MPSSEEATDYSPIYFARQGFYRRSVFIYGAIGQRTYYGCTGKEAVQKYQEEWQQKELEAQEH